VEAGGQKNPSFAQADQHDSSGWKVRPKCLPKRKRGSSIVSMADGGATARIAEAAAFVSMADKGASARIAGAAAGGLIDCRRNQSGTGDVVETFRRNILGVWNCH
jgi:hypothetical protein